MNPLFVDEGSTFRSRDLNIWFAHLFSGPAESSDGFAAELARRGVKCMEFDILNDPQEQNLLDEDVFWKLLNQVRARKFEGLLMKPPSVTFSAYVADGDPLRRPGSVSSRLRRSPKVRWTLHVPEFHRVVGKVGVTSDQ